jgi:hypothetical protein
MISASSAEYGPVRAKSLGNLLRSDASEPVGVASVTEASLISLFYKPIKGG